MKTLKRILIALLIIFIAIQFFRPAKNKSESASPNDIAAIYPVPDSIQSILKVACNDCHSNNTRYPWYAEIQPVAWWLDNHIKDGKKGLNFSEFASYRIKKQYHRMDDINELVKKKEMPLSSYTWIHKDAILTDRERYALASWTQNVKEIMKQRYPADSLLAK